VALNVTDLLDRLTDLVEAGDGETPLLIEGLDGALYPLDNVWAEDLAVVVSAAEAEDDLARPRPSSSASRDEVEGFFVDMLRASVADNPFVDDVDADTLAPAFVAFVRGLVRLGRAYCDADGTVDGLASLVTSLHATAMLFESLRQPVAIDEFTAYLDAQPTAEDPYE
jgi:hypothetical protein